MENLVVNVMKIVYSFGFMLDSAGCKVLHFSTVLMTSLANWVMLHFVLLYLQKLHPAAHRLREAQNLDCQKHSLKVVAVLWMAGVAVYIPVLIYTGKSEHLNAGNGPYPWSSNRIYLRCLTVEASR